MGDWDQANLNLALRLLHLQPPAREVFLSKDNGIMTNDCILLVQGEDLQFAHVCRHFVQRVLRSPVRK